MHFHTARSLPGEKSTVPYIFQMQSIQNMLNALNSRPCKMLFRFLFVCLSVLLAANSASYVVCLSLLIITCFFVHPTLLPDKTVTLTFVLQFLAVFESIRQKIIILNTSERWLLWRLNICYEETAANLWQLGTLHLLVHQQKNWKTIAIAYLWE